MKKISLILILFASSILIGSIVEEHKDIEGPFNTPEEVTKACLECHDDVGEDFIKTRHWLWEGKPFEHKGKKIKLGKQTLLNNFCININSNEPRCTSCHAGYGWKDHNFDFTNQEKIDCMVCHDQTGTYKKFPTGAGYPVYKKDQKVFKGNKKTYKKPDFVKVAQNAGKTSSANCGACHFSGGGGMAVKHGDMDKSLLKKDPKIDAHMGKHGMSCSDCHKGENHNMKGALHASMVGDQNHLSCTDCHKEENYHKTKKVRMGKIIDKHAKSVACETCHIPVVSKEIPTKTWWDWTTAGDKKRKVVKDENGMPLYFWKKGDFKWEKNLKPEYYWYNGKTDYVLLGEKVEDYSGVVELNPLDGGMKDPKSKISPFKVMRGKQFIDPETGFILVPKLFGKGGYWATTDWNAAITKGMKSVNLPYSGKYESVETAMYWPLDHMVAEKGDALKCKSCHSKKGIMDWKALGYKGDPKKSKDSRIKQKIVK